ncbi:cas scaffolding protein family member 4 [Rhynchocyon petersi]
MRGSSAPDQVPKALLAKALYDNHPDSSDELAFCRGDILTILEQNVPESEGWWRCVLRGRQGLAPANRLLVLTKTPEDRPQAPPLGGLEATPANTEDAYQVPTHQGPTLLSPQPTAGPVYEHMRSWVVSPPLTQVYELPEPPPPQARIVCEKMQSFHKQTLHTLPRPVRVSLPALPSQVYDVPAQSRALPAVKELEKQQLYDIPASPQKAGLWPLASQGHSAPRTPPTVRRGNYNTLPNPQKSEWMYRTPVSPEKVGRETAPLGSLVEEKGPSPLPRLTSAPQDPSPENRARSFRQPLYKDLPREKKLSLPELPGLALPRDSPARDDRVSYKVPPSFLVARVEQQNTTPNIYDIPKAMSDVPRDLKEAEKVDRAAEPSEDHGSSWFPPRATRTCTSPEPDRLSVLSSDSSRASVVSSCSSTSTDSSSSSSSEDSTMDLAVARETVTALQEKVASAVASLLVFVSRKWRLREHLEARLQDVRRAVEHIEGSLRGFLDFARGIQEAACHLPEGNLQARIKEQLQTISCSHQILLETKRGLDACHWSLEVLVTDQVQNAPDDLERFVMAARMVPEDVKRFTSMVIANGKLLFKQSCAKDWSPQWNSHTDVKVPEREVGSPPESAPLRAPRTDERPLEVGEQSRTQVCEQNPATLTPQPPSQRTPKKKGPLSEHCRLYFGALFKAISAFTSGLSSSQPPETLITQSKLVIVVGQKLVDTLCRETQERDARNDILLRSNQLCGLLKSLALATKDAVLRHPSPAALQHLLDQAQRLEQHTRLFRGLLE